MEISILLMEQIAELFLIMLIGLAMVKSGFLKPEDSKVTSLLVLYATTPCVIITSFQVELTDERVQGLLLALAAAVIMHAVCLLLGFLFRRIFKLDDVEELSVIYSNAGNIVIPIVIAILGEEYVIYTSAYIAVQLVMMWTHAKSKMAGEPILDIKKMLTNINLVAVAVGVLLFALQIKLPSMLRETMTTVGGLMGPVAMLGVGILLGGVEPKAIFTSGRVYLVSALRLLAAPLILLPALRLAAGMIPVPDAKNVLLVVMLALIAPSAAMITQLAVVYDKHPKEASAINVVTTLTCIVTMPLMVLLYLL